MIRDGSVLIKSEMIRAIVRERRDDSERVLAPLSFSAFCRSPDVRSMTAFSGRVGLSARVFGAFRRAGAVAEPRGEDLDLHVRAVVADPEAVAAVDGEGHRLRHARDDLLPGLTAEREAAHLLPGRVGDPQAGPARGGLRSMVSSPGRKSTFQLRVIFSVSRSNTQMRAKVTSEA